MGIWPEIIRGLYNVFLWPSNSHKNSKNPAIITFITNLLLFLFLSLFLWNPENIWPRCWRYNTGMLTYCLNIWPWNWSIIQVFLHTVQIFDLEAGDIIQVCYFYCSNIGPWSWNTIQVCWHNFNSDIGGSAFTTLLALYKIYWLYYNNGG